MVGESAIYRFYFLKLGIFRWGLTCGSFCSMFHAIEENLFFMSCYLNPLCQHLSSRDGLAPKGHQARPTHFQLPRAGGRVLASRERGPGTLLGSLPGTGQRPRVTGPQCPQGQAENPPPPPLSLSGPPDTQLVKSPPLCTSVSFHFDPSPCFSTFY